MLEDIYDIKVGEIYKYHTQEEEIYLVLAISQEKKTVKLVSLATDDWCCIYGSYPLKDMKKSLWGKLC